VSSLARSMRFELVRDNIKVTDMRVGRTVTAFNANRLGGERRKGAGGRIPEMQPEQVAEGIVRATLDRPQDTVNLRWIDRLIVFANRIVPNFIGRMAARQYK
jgi:short-subunit dehydrogenase